MDEYHTAGQRLPIAGLCRLESEGRRDDLHVGDRIEIWGRLLKPSPPRNPGDFDFAEYLRIRGIGSIVRCKIPEEIRIVSSKQQWSFRRFLKSEQRESIQLLESLVGEEQGALATAMLLGPRHQLPDDLRRAFSESGAAHLLAISGINVAILAGFVWFWGRLFNLRFGAIQWGMLLIVLAYLGLTDASPPLVRAALLLGFSGFGQISRRAIDPLNGLSLAATIILIWNPADLFDIGAQLSFLAVLGLITFDQFYRLWLSVREPKLIERLEDLLPWWERAGRELGKRVLQLYMYTFAIWVFTQPLVLTRFQLLPSLGFIANVLLTPWVTLVLWLGYFVLLLGKVPFVMASGLLTIPGVLLSWGLEVMEWVVRAVSDVPGGHAYLPGPHEWWLWGYYGLLVSACVIPWRHRWWKWTLRCLGGWCLCGFLVLLTPEIDRTTKCTVLSVGHGGAVLLEFPNGQTVLYDCGAMGDPGRVAQTVQTALLRRGKNRIDLMILSHADADHFNGAVDLMKRIRVRRLAVARSFLRMEIGGIRELTESAYHAGVPIQLVRAGDEWEIDSTTKLRCLHPVEGREAKSDNANSIVISMEVGERKILLTGDLDREGLADFLQRPRGHYDVLMAPHHGGRTANPPELGAWAAPEYVIVSGGFARFMGRLSEVYPNAAAIYWTPMHGEITATIDQRGVLTCEPFREGA
ncbi:MAG: DNA internalization-related competence protein ComEC/Rec2, partial [Planctomycetaceae bacterium]|nr:DNA internalization-related competence protein ComEC/Rec2 [Planctomycetaceae bacterium]